MPTIIIIVVSSEEDIVLADDGEECLRALLIDFLFFLALLDFFEDFFLSLVTCLFLKEAGFVLESRLPGKDL